MSGSGFDQSPFFPVMLANDMKMEILSVMKASIHIITPTLQYNGRGVIMYQNPKVPHRPIYYEYICKMRHKIQKH